jgi:hypothetical protein
MPHRLVRVVVIGMICAGVPAAFALDPSQTQTGPAPTPGVTTPTATAGGAQSVSPAAGGTTNALSGGTANAAPSGTGGLADELSDLKRFFTITADVREEYDDNVFSSNSPKIGSLKEEITPSILFSYPMDNGTFDARYTFAYTHYNHSNSNLTDEQDHDIVLRYNHSFSDRFNLDLRDDGGYHEDPSLLNSIGTVNFVGGYYDNIFTGEFTAQWTPLFGTITSYSNNFIYYENGAVGALENSNENTVSEDFRFAFWPTVTYAAGLIYDNIDYFQSSRGFTNYTANTGLDWQALPSLSLGFRVGGSLTDINQGGGTSVSPYASANVNWQLGERSRLIGSYEHTVTPTDVVFAQGEESDRFSANFLYNVTPDITAHLEGVFTYADYTDAFLNAGSNGVSSFDEGVVAFDTGATYHYNQYLDFELGYIFSDVDSQLAGRSYTRNQIYVGVRGTY